MTKTHSNKIIAVIVVLAWTMFCSPVRHSMAAAEKLNIAGYVGTSSTAPAYRMNVGLYSKDKDKIVDSVQTNFFGRYKFEGVEPGTYLVKVGKISKEVVVVKKSMRIDIDLSASDGTMDYAKGAAASGTAAPPIGPNDDALMRAMAAEYYHYSGSTERKVMLCADGRFFGATESGYSGSSRDSLGNENLAWGSASQGRSGGRWTVQGTQMQGTIILNGNDGKQSQVKYQSTGERGCYSFNGNTFCVSAPARCQ